MTVVIPVFRQRAHARTMALTTVLEQPAPAWSAIVAARQVRQVFRLRPVMRQGTASSIPETWERYAAVDEVRKAAKQMYHDDRVLRVFIVTDDCPARFVEWVER
jgi:hypothetical protein